MGDQTKYIFVTGGVLSSLGKGLASAAIGALLESRGLTVTLQKLDPYINVDPGTMNPFEHGEVFVLDDGGEVDMDFGHYERFLNKPTNNMADSRGDRCAIGRDGKLYVADDRDEAIRLSDDYAPEHLEIHVEDTDYYVDRLKNYGSLFIGEETTVAYGDKSIGTNHILPTSRSARYTGGVWVGKFLKTVTFQKMTPEASVVVGEVTARQCEVERMLAHGITATVRTKRYAKTPN